MGNVRKRIRLVRKGGPTGTPVPPAPGGAISWTPADGDAEGGGFGAVSVVTLPEIGFEGNTVARGAVTIPSLAIVANTALRQAVTLPALATNSNTNARARVTAEYTAVDVQPKHDMYLDENTPGTNFGTATGLLAKTNAAVGNNRQHTYIGFDMTGVSGTVTAANVKLEIRTSLVLGETATYTVFTHPTQPFTEGTATWTNTEPPPGTSRGTISQAVTTTATVYTLTFDSTQRANMPGNWVYLRCTGGAALAGSTITTTSKEGTNKPRLTFTVTI